MLSSSYKQLAYKYQAADWLLIVVLLLAVVIMNTAGTPHCRSFEWTDASINYPTKPDTFPVYSLALMTLFVPAFYVVFSRFCVEPVRRLLGEPLSLLSSAADGAAGDVAVTAAGGANGGGSSPPPPNSGAAGGRGGRGRGAAALEPVKVRALKCGTGPIYPWLKAHVWALVLELFVVDFMKLYAGRLRPDFLARLAKDGYTPESTKGHDPRTDVEYFCALMKDHHAIREGRLSFPSGHSGTSCAIFTITTFYLLAHLRPFARQGSLIRLLVSLSPMLVPIFCAVSRTRDNKHNFSDIMAGSFIGMVAALLVIATVFRQAGGPLTVYLARSENDVEYVKQLLIAGGGKRSTGTLGGLAQRRSTPAADYNTTNESNSASNNANAAGGTEMRSYPPGAATTTDDGTTVAVPIGGSPTLNGGSSAYAHEERVVVVTTVGERELNEDPAAVPWL